MTGLDRLLAGPWNALTAGDGTATRAPDIAVSGGRGHLRSRFATEDLAVACVAAALSAAARLDQPENPVAVDRAHVAAAVTSERWFRRGGESAGAGFAPLSKFWRAADGWVRTHANYPWHRAALLETLGVADDGDAVAAAIAARNAEDIEEAVFAAGGIAARVRTIEEWRVHPQGVAVGAEPLIDHEMLGEAPPRSGGSAPGLPGVRVLDLTRVIAGPVCTRFLGALGADVLRLDPPGHLDMRVGAPADTLLGKRSAFADFSTAAGVDQLHTLLGAADVVVCGYRPGALDRFALDPGSLADRHPGIVAVYLDAWGHTGPWARRRGFDSVVQGPTGIAMGESDDGATPGALPCQLLDHGTGYLAAAAALDGLRRQRRQGGTHVRRLSLARTAGWVTSTAATALPEERTEIPQEPDWLVDLAARDTGPVTAVAPPGVLGSRKLAWPSPVTSYGADEPVWSAG